MKGRFLILLVCLALIPFRAFAGFSRSSDVFDPDLAQYALQISELCHTPSMQESVLKAGGFRRLGCWNYDRDRTDSRHVAAYSVFERDAGNGRTEVIVAVRGTGSGEWKLNLDLMPSGNYDLPYAENFRLAAEDILTSREEYLSSLSDPVFLITGHSRGAAVANLLGVSLTDRFGADRVFVYTFATPRTVRGDRPEYGNIFNIINPADLITYLPFPAWGFERYGTDILLPVDQPESAEAARQAYANRSDQLGTPALPDGSADLTREIVAAMEALAPDMREGYTLRHALSHPGEALPDEDGMTTDEMLLMLFEGSTFSMGLSGNDLSALTQAPNDFSPLLRTLQHSFDIAGNGWLTGTHMPAAYGAWITAVTPPASGTDDPGSLLPE